MTAERKSGRSGAAGEADPRDNSFLSDGLPPDNPGLGRNGVHPLDQKNLWQTILDGIPDIINLQTTDHTILAYNKAGYDVLEQTPEGIQGQKCYQLLGRMIPCDSCAPLWP